MVQANLTVSDLPKNTAPAQQRVPAMRALLGLGQSVWLDDLRRRMTRSGELASMIDEGLRGMTSNPSIFEHAMSDSPDYDAGLVELMNRHRSNRAVFEAIAVEDVREAADVFRPVYEATSGGDGFVSIEVSPEYARDTKDSIAEARHLWYAVDRPNVMIKIPGTRAGWPAIEHCLREGININITLLFSVEHYRAVAEAYLRALEARIAAGQRIDRLSSVASMFVSRIDTEVDRRIEEKGGALAALRGRVAIANARLTYAAFLELTHSTRWRALADQGARVQRPLWASTGTKNPNYSDIRYVQSLIGAETISTIPPATLRAFEDHGSIERTLSDDPGDAAEVMKTLADGGIDFADVNRTLENEGIQKFTASLEHVLRTLAEKRARLTGGAATRGGPRPSTDA
jgi:transaldolase